MKAEEKVLSKTVLPLAVVVGCGDSRLLNTRLEDLGSFRAARLEIGEVWCRGPSHDLA